MNIAVIIPRGNENVLVDRAKELGYEGIVFLYANVTKVFETDVLKTYSGVVIAPKSVSELNKFVNRAYKRSDMIAVTSKDEGILRAAFENDKVDIVFGVTTSFDRDHTHFRKSNLNNVLANLAKSNRICYGVDFSTVLNLDGIARAKLLGREMQNTRLLRRKTGVIISSFSSDVWAMRNASDLQANLQILGLNGGQAKAGTSEHIFKIVKKNQKIRSQNYVMAGVEIVS